MSVMWYDPFDFIRPSRIMNRHRYAFDTDDLFTSWPSYCRPWRRTVSQPDETTVPAKAANDKFQVSVDVQQFQPEEITVRVTDDNMIIVEAKHEERPDEHGFISRQFVRKYIVPKEHDMGKVMSNLSSDGVLTITAPKKEAVKDGQREIRVQQTGQPSRVAEKPSGPPPQPQEKPVEKNIEIKKEAESKPEEKASEPVEKNIEIKLEAEVKKEEKPADVGEDQVKIQEISSPTPNEGTNVENPLEDKQ